MATFEAYFWEVKPVKQDSINESFEFVLVNSSSLKMIKAEDQSFNKYFESNKKVVSFSNLRKDAELIVPTRISNHTEYAHLAKFVRSAGEQQILEFWKCVVQIYKDKIEEELKWLSTSGLGVHWLHVRVDSKPKYYQHLEYKFF